MDMDMEMDMEMDRLTLTPPPWRGAERTPLWFAA